MSLPLTHPLCLSASQLARIAASAMAGYPDEVCGLLIGTDTPAGRKITRVEVAKNALPQHERADRFAIDPLHLKRAEADAAAKGETILGFYHSHPDAPARPSETDTDAAWPFYSYVIVAVTAHGVIDTASWILNDATGTFESQPFE